MHLQESHRNSCTFPTGYHKRISEIVIGYPILVRSFFPTDSVRKVHIVSFCSGQARPKPRLRLPSDLCACLSALFLSHWRLLASSSLTMISGAGCLIFFPTHLEAVTEGAGSDGYSACLAAVSLSTGLLLVTACGLKAGRPRSRNPILSPVVSWTNIGKIGFSVGLSLLTLFSSWENHKVLCNLQDPLLGLMFIFAVVTHAVSRWRTLGYRRSFGLLTVSAGVFVSVDYTLVDHHRCRGHYYATPPKDPWTFEVHLVWTLAFVVSIWLWTVAMFCMESAFPLPQSRPKKVHREEYNAVRMKVMRVTGSESTVLEEPDLFQGRRSTSATIRRLREAYAPVTYLRVFNGVLWFHLATLLITASLFWTEFIPGFGRGVTLEVLPAVLAAGFRATVTGPGSWCLIVSGFIFSQSFAYLLLLLQSPIISLAVACLGFPIVGIWWSVFQFQYNLLVWMPILSGELVCAFLGFPLILGGAIYLFKLDVLRIDHRARDGGVVSSVTV